MVGNDDYCPKSTCFTTWDVMDSMTPYKLVFKKNEIKREYALPLLCHKAECGREQVKLMLQERTKMEGIVNGTNYNWRRFLLDWKVPIIIPGSSNSNENHFHPKANILHLATEMKNLKLLQVIYDLRETQASECIRIGLDESITFAAENQYLESLNFLIDMHNDPGEIFNRCILAKKHLLKPLLHESAQKDCNKIFKWILQNVNEEELKTYLTTETTTFFHSIAKGRGETYDMYQRLVEKLVPEDGSDKSKAISLLKEILEKQDEDGNSALHLAAKEPITEDNLKMISNMLEKGVLPSLKNKVDETFLQMSQSMSLRLRQHINLMEDDWFASLIKNDELLTSFIKLQDDDIFCSILKRFSKLTMTKGAVHPIKLLDYIWMSRDVLPKSLDELLSWEGKCHKS